MKAESVSDDEAGKQILGINARAEEGESLVFSGNYIVLARLQQRPCGDQEQSRLKKSGGVRQSL